MLAKLKTFLAASGGLLAALFAAYFFGRKDGANSKSREDLSAERARGDLSAEGGRIDRETASRSENDLREELNKWAN